MTPYVSRNIRQTELESVRAVIYARQSKRRVDESETSTESQIGRGTALAEGKGWKVGRVFQDIGKSGWDPDTERAGFDAMMAAVRAGEVDVVVVFSLARLTLSFPRCAGGADQLVRRGWRGFRFTCSAVAW
ncbi:recombinase family protein, partial [Kitasatospora sp. NPDC048296]|uniref:recombinase family protein n=1 Tax=Kitasatospora sp. NPDC048296 TaxID=3364048 RepID=UPI003712E983